MKAELLFWASLGGGVFISLFGACEFRKTQEIHFNQTKSEQCFLQKNLKTLQDDYAFMRNHQKEFAFLVKKGWYSPTNRLIAGESIGKFQSLLNEVQYTFEPEYTKTLGEAYTFKVTKIVIDVGALLDSDVYDFIHELLKQFPGILIPLEITLAHGENVNEDNLLALRHKERPNFIAGRLVFEWFAMGEENHEK